MKSLLVALLSLALPVLVNAASIDKEGYARALKKLSTEGCEQVHNGDCSISKYNPKKFNYNKTLQKLRKQFASKDSGYRILSELKWKNILDDMYVKESGVPENLEYFLRNKQVKAMYLFYPDPDVCTESEYCSYNYLYIYLEGGEVVYFEFNFTT